MGTLLDAYKKYYSDPTPESADELLTDVKNAEKTAQEELGDLEKILDDVLENDYNVFRTLKEATAKSNTALPDATSFFALRDGEALVPDTDRTFEIRNFRSNGSQNPPTTFVVGPNATQIQNDIEGHVRRRNNNVVCIHNETELKHIQQKVEQTYSSKGPVNILGTPRDFMRPSTDPRFNEWVENNPHLFNLIVNMYWEPFFHFGTIPTNDQMVDWRSGLNFYTCEKGNKHVLQIYIEKEGLTRNLLNVASNWVPKSDKFEIKNYFLCPCGKLAANLEFIPHYQNMIIDRHGEYFYEPDIVKQLKGTYKTLQFYQDPADSRIFVAFVSQSGKLHSKDSEYIGDLLSTRGFDFSLLPYRAIRSGDQKYPTFWRIEPEKIVLEKDAILKLT